MRAYHLRNIRFEGIETHELWKIKLYTISIEEEFQSLDYLKYVKKKIPELLNGAKKHYHRAFIIVHEASDGVWTIVSWWTGEVMLKTFTYHSKSNERLELNLLKSGGSMACVWEMAVLNHERLAWIKHVLQQSEQPDYEGYELNILNRWV